MKLVLDTNVLLKALIKDSIVRGIIVGPKHEFLIPEYAIEEIRKHMHLIEEKSRLSLAEIDSVLETLLTNVRRVSERELLSTWKEVEEIMAPIDRNDTAFFATAMGAPCDGIWSDDRHLKLQKKVKVWRTKDVLEL